jgi:hypothetical protein
VGVAQEESSEEDGAHSRRRSCDPRLKYF